MTNKTHLETIEKEDGSAVVQVEDSKDDVIIVEGEDRADQSPSDAHDGDDRDAQEDSEADDYDKAKEKAATNRKNYETRQRNKARRHAAERADKAMIAQLRSENQTLLERMVKLENSQQGLQVSRLEGAIDNQESLIAQIKQHMISVEDRATYVELAERLADEKLKLRELKTQKDATVKAGDPEQKKIGNPRKADEDRLTRAWMARNTWFDTNGRGGDSKIAIALSDTLVEEGFDASSPEYWDELDIRLRDHLPHRYERGARAAPPVGSSRNERARSTYTEKPGEVHLSAARKEAMIEAGVWNDPVARNRVAKLYQKYDKENA